MLLPLGIFFSLIAAPFKHVFLEIQNIHYSQKLKRFNNTDTNKLLNKVCPFIAY